jgi:type IV pilus assembly protein PilX
MFPRAQQGAVMVVALIFLMLLTLLAISASSRSLLQERMAGGLRNAQLAEIGAEAALRGAEWRLWSLPARGIRLNCPSDSLANCYAFDATKTGSGWTTPDFSDGLISHPRHTLKHFGRAIVQAAV